MGEVLVQHRRRDDHFVKRLIVTPDRKVSGILLVAATGGGVGMQIERETGARDDRAGRYLGMQKKQQVAETEKATGGETEGEDIEVHTVLPLLQNSAPANTDMTVSVF